MALYVATVEVDNRRHIVMDVTASDKQAALQALIDLARERHDASVIIIRNIVRALPIFADGERAD